MASKALKFFGVGFILLCIVGAVVAWYAYSIIYNSNVNDSSEPHYIYLKEGATFDTVVKELEENKVLKDVESFKRVAALMKYRKKIKPGKYLIANGMSNRELVHKLRLGKQEPVKVVINKVRELEKFVGAATRNISADSLKLLTLLRDPNYLKDNNLTSTSLFTEFIPDTYEFYWNTDEDAFVQKMKAEKEKFWNEERFNKAKEKKLTPYEVSVLASIVDEEAYHLDEMDEIAQVYLNRLDIGMALQADPTVKFAVGDFTLKRILNVHLEKDSPYNTYMYPGLPPGPICLPSKTALDAVLNPAEHKYLYFCAKDDFSMYHSFATNLSQHMKNAKRYQMALNRKKIFK